uniref:Rhs family protein n=5 Tax=Vibrio splendidus TaxID=29497 RepID=A0A0H3ZJK7_VIBSP|nr:Rhs family protein [Vibrio splendidus]
MNGRIYDAELGRFLSADPFVQSPFKINSFNRYSYVMNNPLRYEDPTGYFWKEVKSMIDHALKSIGNVFKGDKSREMSPDFTSTKTPVQKHTEDENNLGKSDPTEINEDGYAVYRDGKVKIVEDDESDPYSSFREAKIIKAGQQITETLSVTETPVEDVDNTVDLAKSLVLEATRANPASIIAGEVIGKEVKRLTPKRYKVTYTRITEYELTEQDAVVDTRNGQTYSRGDVRVLDRTLRVRDETTFRESRPSGTPSENRKIY